MAGQALWRFFRLGTNLKNPRHPLSNVSGQSLIRSPMLVFDNPGGVFIL